MDTENVEMFGEYSAHRVATFFPMIVDDELRELADDIKANGQARPCVVDGGILVDGRNRWRACEMAGVTPLVEERTFPSDEARALWIVSENVHRRHMSPSAKALVAARLGDYFRGIAAARKSAAISASKVAKKDVSEVAENKEENQVRAHVHEPGQVVENKRDYEKENERASSRMAADAFDSSMRTVGMARSVIKHGDDELVKAVERGTVTLRAADDLTLLPKEAQRAAVKNADVATATAKQARKHKDDAKALAKLSRAVVKLGDKIDTLDEEQIDEQIKKMSKSPHMTINTGNDEWYTPRSYIDMARAVLGVIDLDPASNDVAQEKVKAKTYYTKDRSGLDEVWAGRVWMNPPYSRGLMMRFCAKLCGHVEAGDVTHAVVLTHNGSDTEWWQTLARTSSAMCHTDGRVKFVNPVEEKASPTQGQTFFYMGDDVAAFVEHFASVGIVTVPYVK